MSHENSMVLHIRLSPEEALARMSEDNPIECSWERIPNNGNTDVGPMAREGLVNLIKQGGAAESGICAQVIDKGIYLPLQRTNQDGSKEDGLLFIQTKPYCRLNEAQLAESIRLQRGQNLFSDENPAKDQADRHP